MAGANGSGEASTAGQTEPTGEGGTQPVFTPEQQKFVNDIVTAAITARDKRHKEEVRKLLAEQKKKDEPPPEDDDELEGETADDDEAEVAPKKKVQEPPPKKVDPKMKRMAQEIEQLKKSNKEEAAKRQATEQAARDQRVRAEMRDALTKHGCKPECLDLAVKALFGEVSIDEENGQAMLPMDNGVAPIDGAIEFFMRSPAGKVFAAAPTAGGSGAKKGSTARVTKSVKEMNWLEKLEALDNVPV